MIPLGVAASGKSNSAPPVTAWADTFTRADSASVMGTTETGAAAWTPMSGTWGISSNRAYNAGNTSDSVVAIEAGSATQTAQVTLSSITGTTGTGLVLRATNKDNCIQAVSQALVIRVYKRIAGTYTELTITGTQTFADGDTLKITVNGTAGAVFRNGTQVGTFTENSGLTGTKVGFCSNGNGPRFDNFSASTP